MKELKILKNFFDEEYILLAHAIHNNGYSEATIKNLIECSIQRCYGASLVYKKLYPDYITQIDNLSNSAYLKMKKINEKDRE